MSTCTAMNPTESSDTLRCSADRTSRGSAAELNRAVPATPSATVIVSSTRATTPVARVAYHRGLGPEPAAASVWATAPDAES